MIIRSATPKSEIAFIKHAQGAHPTPHHTSLPLHHHHHHPHLDADDKNDQDEGYHDHAVTLLLVAWGQFIDHDITRAAETKDAM